VNAKSLKQIRDLRHAEVLHARRHVGITTEQLAEAALRTVVEMSPDEKAHLRAKLNRSVGVAPKSSGGKPS
jgi:hypothetical protein